MGGLNRSPQPYSGCFARPRGSAVVFPAMVQEGGGRAVAVSFGAAVNHESAAGPWGGQRLGGRRGRRDGAEEGSERGGQGGDKNPPRKKETKQNKPDITPELARLGRQPGARG